MRADRLLDLVALLRRHERLTAADLARRLGVSRRTVLRDLDALSLSGVPVFAEHGRGGGFSILPGYRPEAAGLSPEELTALFLPGGEAAAQAIGRGGEFRSARRKLETVLSGDAARAVGDVTSWLLVVPEGWGQPVEPPAHLQELAAATARHEVVDLGYRAAGQRARPRRVRPLGLVLAARTWYLVALRDDSSEQRTYRVDRVTSVSPVGRHFEPAPPTLEQRWALARASFVERDGVALRLRVREELLPVVTYVVSIAGRVTGRVEVGDGLFEVTGVAERLGVAASMLAGLGTRAEILEPAELLTAILEVSRSNLERYA